MPLTTGSRLGPYEILSLLGTGGMGEVYRARDTKLNRDVALKILPDSFAHDPERVARFKREAQVLASLNHPNIAAIYGLEESGGIRAPVLDLVEGPTLAEYLAGAGSTGPGLRTDGSGLPVQEVLPIAKQIVDALEAAHEHGVIHRDLKPANIKVRRDGTVKVLDFGLAKAFEPETVNANFSNSPTLSLAATQQGVILGTAAYMSPEQAKGRPIDRRTDIFSFGCVLYEMLTGRAAFEGDDVPEILGAVLKSEPDWTQVPPSVPLRIQELLRLCLASRGRWRDRRPDRRAMAGVHGGRDLSAMAARRERAVLHRAERPDDGGADHGVRYDDRAGRTDGTVSHAHLRRRRGQSTGPAIRRGPRRPLPDQHGSGRGCCPDHAHPQLEAETIERLDGVAGSKRTRPTYRYETGSGADYRSELFSSERADLRMPATLAALPSWQAYSYISPAVACMGSTAVHD